MRECFFKSIIERDDLHGDTDWAAILRNEALPISMLKPVKTGKSNRQKAMNMQNVIAFHLFHE